MPACDNGKPPCKQSIRPAASVSGRAFGAPRYGIFRRAFHGEFCKGIVTRAGSYVHKSFLRVVSESRILHIIMQGQKPTTRTLIACGGIRVQTATPEI